MTTLARFIRFGALVGAGYGVIEGAVSAGLSFLPGTLLWDRANGPQALLVAPVFYMVVYAAVGGAAGLLAGWSSRLPWGRLLFTGLAALSGFLLAGQLSHYFGTTTALVLGAGAGAIAWRTGAGREPMRLPTLRQSGLALLMAPLPGLLLLGLLIRAERAQEASLPATPSGAPNVLLLVLDTQRADHLGAYGYDRPTTPRLDQLAAEGVLYEFAISGAPWTLPSHATLLTGRRVWEHRAGERGIRHLNANYPTLAESFQAAGWRTGGFVGNTHWTGRHTGLNRGFLHYDDFYGTVGDAITRTALGYRASYFLLPRLGLVDIPGRKRAATVNREFLAWEAQDRARPFFAFLNYFDVHSPYLPPPSTAGRFTAGEGKVARTTRIEIGARDGEDHPPDSSLVAHWRNAYDESLLDLDASLGALFDSLKERRQLDNTIVVVTGDHGESFGEHGLVHHGGGLYESQIRVPLIMRYPGRLPAGTRVHTPVDLADLAVSLTTLAGVPSGGLGGVAFDWRDNTRDGRSVVSEAPSVEGNPRTWPTGLGWVESVYRDSWHLILRQDGQVELFDLRSDSAETTNRATGATGDSVTASLLAELRGELPHPPAPSGGEGPTDAPDTPRARASLP